MLPSSVSFINCHTRDFVLLGQIWSMYYLMYDRLEYGTCLWTNCLTGLIWITLSMSLETKLKIIILSSMPSVFVRWQKNMSQKDKNFADWCCTPRRANSRFQSCRWHLCIGSMTLSLVSVICQPDYVILKLSYKWRKYITNLYRQCRGAIGMVEISRISHPGALRSTCKKFGTFAYMFFEPNLRSVNPPVFASSVKKNHWLGLSMTKCFLQHRWLRFQFTVNCWQRPKIHISLLSENDLNLLTFGKLSLRSSFRFVL